MKKALFSAALLLILAVGVGCDQPNHRWEISQREKNLRRTTHMFQDIEADRPDNLRRSVTMFQDQYEYDQRRTRENARRVDQAVQSEVDFWNEREPIYRQRIQELMQGDPGAIDRTLPLVIY